MQSFSNANYNIDTNRFFQWATFFGNLIFCVNSIIGIRKRLHLLVFDNFQYLDN